MNWTNEKPQVAGWYWWRESKVHSETIVSVSSSYAMKQYVYVRGQSFDLDNIAGEWAGPLNPPRELEKSSCGHYDCNEADCYGQ